MKIPLLFNFFRKSKISLFRRYMSGYKILNELGFTENRNLMLTIKNEFAETVLFNENVRLSSMFFGEEIKNVEKSIRQFLLARLYNIPFNKEILSVISDKKYFICYPIPKTWQKILLKYELSVSNKYCSYLFFFYALKRWLIGSAYILLYILLFFQEIITKKYKNLNLYCYFPSLKKNNIITSNKDEKNYNILSWYINWKGKSKARNNKKKYLCHNFKPINKLDLNNNYYAIYLNLPIKPIHNFNNLFKFISWSLFSILYSAMELILNKPWYAIMLKEAALSKIARIQESNNFAIDYMFHEFLYKPLWTYEAERKGSRIMFYFYSTNNEGFKNKHGYKITDFDIKLQNWPEYLVWNKYQADWLKRSVKNVGKINVVGPIYFSDKPTKIPSIPFNSAAVFDIQIYRDTHIRLLTSNVQGLEIDYNTPGVSNKFLVDVYEILEKFGMYMVHKSKRSTSFKGPMMLHPKYKKCLSELYSKEKVIKIDPEISAKKIIDKCQIVISIPFTSTSLIGKDQKKPSIFYDPLGLVHVDDKAAHDVEIISGKEHLSKWIAENIKK